MKLGSSNKNLVDLFPFFILIRFMFFPSTNLICVNFMEEKCFPDLFPYGVGGYMSSVLDGKNPDLTFANYVRQPDETGIVAS